MFKLDLERERKQRSNCQHPLDHRKNNRIPEKHVLLLHSLCYKAFDGMDHNGNIKLPYLPPEKPVCRSRSNRMGDGTTDWFKIGKAVCQDCILSPCLLSLYAEYIKVVYCHPAYLTYMQNTSCKMPCWVKQRLESRLPGEISITSDMQMIPPLWQTERRK